MSEHLFDKVFSVNLTEWARRQGIHPQTAYRWFRNGTLPVPAVRVNARSVLIAPDSVLASPADGLGLYARVSSTTNGPISTGRSPACASGRPRPGCRSARVESEVWLGQ